jgi:type III secretion protein S
MTMSQASIIQFTVEALTLVLLLSLPPIVVASAVGLLVSLIQAVTQIQDQTLAFAVKLIAVIVTILLTGKWIGGELYNYAVKLFDMFPVTLG